MDSDRSPTVVLTVTTPRWHHAMNGAERQAEPIVRAVVETATDAAWARAGEISLMLTDDEDIRRLNATYRQRDHATNVLSFPGQDLVDGEAAGPAPPEPALLGDIVMSLDRLEAEAADLEKPLADHFAHLLVHGTLHLLGYDHDEDERAASMEAFEASILDSLGFAAPYPPYANDDVVPGEGADRPSEAPQGETSRLRQAHSKSVIK